MGAVREVVRVAGVAAVPAALAAHRGVMPYRDHYVSLISLAALLGGVLGVTGRTRVLRYSSRLRKWVAR